MLHMYKENESETETEPGETAATAVQAETETDNPNTGEHLGYLLIKLGEVVLAMAEQALAPLGVRARQFNVMRIVASNPTLSQQDLSKRLGLDPTIMVALIDGLERKGLLRRQRSQQDRRRHELRLTKDGEAVLKRASRAIDAAEKTLLAPVDLSEKRTLSKLAVRLLASHGPIGAALQ